MGEPSWIECPNGEPCQSCPCADEDDVCFPGERLRADLATANVALREFKSRLHGNGETITAADARQLIRRYLGEHSEPEVVLAMVERAVDSALAYQGI